MLRGSVLIPIEHPFTRIPDGKIRLFAVPCAFATVLLFLAMHLLVSRGPGWPAFASLVLSSTTQQATSILSHWTTEDRGRVLLVARMDLLFGLLFATLLALSTVWAARRASQREYAHLGSDFAWLSSLLVVFDVPENLACENLVRGEVGQPWPIVSASCVVIRSFLGIVILIFVIRTLQVAQLAEEAGEKGDR